ncbi:MAG: sigma-70 family RNA polymerase sigma factor [Planctomycetaceae bacterium]|nr:MAG: sigma-70 family RNA polymerase sigma factor [Planctomycetaceae bacterium]
MQTTAGTSKSTLSWYLEHIKGTPLLSAEQERQLSRRIREHSDPVAREQMVAANLRLVVKIAKDYSNRGMTLGDLVAEGNLGLLRAVEEFDPDAGVRFCTYASWWIKQSLKRAMINAGQPIHIPAYMAKMITKWRQASRRFENANGRAPTTAEMAAKLHISEKKAGIIEQGLQAVNAPTQVASEESRAISEMIPDDTESLPEQALMDASNSPTVRKLLARLDERSRKILEMRFGMDGYEGPERTYKQIGQAIGLTRERVRQLEKQSLTQLKKLMD